MAGLPRPRFPRSSARAAELLLGVSILLLVAATPAEARNVTGQFRVCMAQDARHIERALDACDAVAQYGTLPQVRRALVSAAFMRAAGNDFTAAEANLQRAVDINSEDASALLALGKVQAQLNKPDDALLHLEAADRLSPEPAISYEARLAMGALWAERQHWADALDAYGRALTVAASPAERARAQLGRGDAKLGQGQIYEAIADFARAGEDDPRSVDARLALADAYRTLAFRPGQTSDPSAFANAALVYGQALDLLTPVSDRLEQRRLRARVLSGRGDLYLQRHRAGESAGALQQATLDFEAAVALDSESVAALAGRASVYAETPVNRSRAVADLDRALRMAPNDPGLYRARGDLYTEIGDVESAMRDYDQSVQHGDGQSYDTYFQRGIIYMSRGDFHRADQNFARALALAEGGYLPPGADANTARANALDQRSRATWNFIDEPGADARQVALVALRYADQAATLEPAQSRFAASRCLTRSVAGGYWRDAEAACAQAINLARQTGDRSDLGEAYGAMGMLQLRWALAGAATENEEAQRLSQAETYFRSAATADDHGAAPGRARVALHRYARGVALECLGRNGEAAREMRDALDADRAVAARFATYRTHRCGV